MLVSGCSVKSYNNTQWRAWAGASNYGAHIVSTVYVEVNTLSTLSIYIFSSSSVTIGRLERWLKLEVSDSSVTDLVKHFLQAQN